MSDSSAAQGSPRTHSLRENIPLPLLSLLPVPSLNSSARAEDRHSGGGRARQETTAAPLRSRISDILQEAMNIIDEDDDLFLEDGATFLGGFSEGVQSGNGSFSLPDEIFSGDLGSVHQDIASPWRSDRDHNEARSRNEDRTSGNENPFRRGGKSQ